MDATDQHIVHPSIVFGTNVGIEIFNKFRESAQNTANHHSGNGNDK
jgi:hypothetical protein